MTTFPELYAKFNTGDPKEKIVPAGPEMVDIEPVGLCNFRCLMCDTGLGSLGRPQGFMKMATYQSILNKTDEFNSAIRLIGWGEPLMHPDIVEFVARASQSNRITHLNTNGSKITNRLAEDLTDAGLTSIKFSFQGTDKETYAAMRRVDFFDGLIDAIKIMNQARGYAKEPYISASTTTTYETPDMIQAFRERLEPYVDSLSIGKTIFDHLDIDSIPLKQRPKFKEAASRASFAKNHPLPCKEVYGKLAVAWDGDVRVCCNDAKGISNLGNFNTDSIESIWHHPTMDAYRERLNNKEYSGPLCSVCYEYMPLAEGKNV